jgi:hypothetical protein
MIKKNQIENYEETSGIDTSTYAGKAIKAVKSKSRGIIGDDLLIFTLLDFMSFMMLNNKFASKGIFITSENREEKYIEMIESGEEDLINSLEEYINLLDKIKLLEEKKKEVDEIIFKLQCLKDYNEEEQVNEIIKDYLRR